MKIFYLLLFLASYSCKSDFDKDNLKFEIHKFYTSNNNQIGRIGLGCFGYDLKDYSKISIDSIKEYPKYIYLQGKIEFEKQMLKTHIKYEEHNPNSYNERIVLSEQNLDSLITIFNGTRKDENYYKCYFSYPEKNYNVIILNEKYKPIECFFELHEDE